MSGLLHRFVDGFEVLARGRRLLWITALSVLVWLVVTLSYYLAFFAFGLHLPIQAGVVLLVLTALASAPPAQKPALLRVLGAVGGANALDAVRAAAGEANAEVKGAALRALAAWKTADAAPAPEAAPAE